MLPFFTQMPLVINISNNLGNFSQINFSLIGLKTFMRNFVFNA